MRLELSILVFVRLPATCYVHSQKFISKWADPTVDGLVTAGQCLLLVCYDPPANIPQNAAGGKPQNADAGAAQK